MHCFSLELPPEDHSSNVQEEGGVPFSARQKAQAGLVRTVATGRRARRDKRTEWERGPDGDHFRGGGLCASYKLVGGGQVQVHVG